MAQELTPSKSTSRKRKEPPTNASNIRHDAKRPRNDHRSKQRDARVLATQTSSKALKNGELDVDKFVKAREYEIRALQDGMARSKKALTKRAFQQVPKDLRRRTASHNVKKVPKRLQKRANREMADDNTPTVTARRRKPTRHMRLRIETAKKLRALGVQRKKQKHANDEVTVQPVRTSGSPNIDGKIDTRTPKIKKAKLAKPPVPRAKFRKRQISKTWLPTHMFHAKRARMTLPKEPLWRFAIPMTPTAKSYRPTHRAAHERGAIAWDMSYMSTVGLEGQQRSIETVLKALQVDEALWTAKGNKWRDGVRVWDGFVFTPEAPYKPIASVTMLWSAVETVQDKIEGRNTQKRKVLIRVHPSAFFELWEEIVRLGKVARPQVNVEDLRFEIGSIEIIGPGSTEALLGALQPFPLQDDPQRSHTTTAESTWTSLSGLADPSVLPAGVLLGLDVQDPRLHHPPKAAKLSRTAEEQMRLLELTADWPLDSAPKLASLFDRRARVVASAALPSQKGIDRRKGLAAPGQYPEPLPTDPKIPALVYTSTAGHKKQSKWSVLLPWKCVQPVWYSIMYCPLSTGGQPRFGGLDEARQLAFESGQPWFPGDFAGTKAGWEWELEERKKRKEEWLRRPKSKRINWDAVDLRSGRKGEIGLGWACDWERLVDGPRVEPQVQGIDTAADSSNTAAGDETPAAVNRFSMLTHLPTFVAESLLHSSINLLDIPDDRPALAVTVRITCLTRGMPQHCARIYRLPSKISSPDLRKEWLALHPRQKPIATGPKSSLPRLPKNAPPHIVQRRLAQSLLEPAKAGEEVYPPCPGGEDLIGFVTTGNLNLAEGKGTGIGCVLLGKVLDDVRKRADHGKLCIVRNAGSSIGRLAEWALA